jgi:hypothetical protein
VGLAERLDLRPPFKLMQAKGLEDSAKIHKRTSSASSCLEPAMLPESDPSLRPLIVSQPHRTKQHSSLRQSKASQLDGEASIDERSQSEASSQRSRASSAASAIFPKYERRPRRRTREDRYELKEARKRKRPSRENETKNKKCKRRKCRQKTSAAILHDFSAENIEADRLTVGTHQDTPGGILCSG